MTVGAHSSIVWGIVYGNFRGGYGVTVFPCFQGRAGDVGHTCQSEHWEIITEKVVVTS